MSRFPGAKGHRAVTDSFHSPIIGRFSEFRGDVPRQTLFRRCSMRHPRKQRNVCSRACRLQILLFPDQHSALPFRITSSFKYGQPSLTLSQWERGR